MKLKAYAKINLALDILGQDPSGFHLVQTVLHEIPDLFDEIEIERADKIVGVSEDDTAYKAAKLLGCGARIKIKKNIPVQSGLGGASSDAAAVLKGLNELYNLGFSDEKLCEIGEQIGMDVPFFIKGGTALATHFGEKITPLPAPIKVKFEIIPGEKISTKEAYASIDLKNCGKNKSKTEALICALKNEDKIIECIHNDFPGTKKGAYLTGSGGAFFKVIQL